MTDTMTIDQYRRHLGLPTESHRQESAALSEARAEKELQRLCEQELSRRGIRAWLHLRTRAQAAACPGWPDLVFCCKGIPFAVELKTPSGRLRPEQERQLADMARDGWRVEVVRTFEQFRELFSDKPARAEGGRNE